MSGTIDPDSPERGSRPSKHALASERTRAALLCAARELFTQRGFINTTTEDLVVAAGVTRGALYYQFSDKIDLFRAVCDELIDEVLAAANDRLHGEDADPWTRLGLVARVYLESTCRPDIQRVLVLDARAVLPPDRPSGVRSDPLFQLAERLACEAAEELVSDRFAQMLASSLAGAADALAAAVCNAEDPDGARETAFEVMDHLIGGVRHRFEPAPDNPPRS